jgi:pectinesterase
MTRYAFLLLGVLTSGNLISQSRITDSLTYQTDSSYQLTVAFEKAKKADKNAAYPVVTSTNLKEMKLYKTGNNKQLDKIVYLPKPKNRNKSVVVFIFGGGWRSGSAEMNHHLALALVENGYTVVLPNYPLSTHVQYPAALYKLKHDIAFIRYNAKKWKVHPDKIAVGGFSAGGMLASLLATSSAGMYADERIHSNERSIVNALINIDGTLSFVHPEGGEGDDSEKLSAATMWLGYKKADNYKLWEEASPLTHANEKTPPTLFINSNIDRMHAGREDYKKILDRYHIYHEQKTFDTPLHHFPFFEPWFTPMVNTMDHFLQKVFRLK